MQELTIEPGLGAVPNKTAFRCDDAVMTGCQSVAADVAEGGNPGFNDTFGQPGGTWSTVGKVGNGKGQDREKAEEMPLEVHDELIAIILWAEESYK